MSKISELTDGGSLLPTDFLIAVRSGGNVKVQADDITVDQIRLGDNEKIELGNSQDLQIYHDGSNSYIKDDGTGNLFIQGTSLQLENAAGENFVNCVSDGTVAIYFNNDKKFETTSTGIQVTGNIANVSGDLTLDVAGDIILDADGGDVRLADGGTQFARLSDGTEFTLSAMGTDKDIKFAGNDGGVAITALTLDMSDEGAAIFNGHGTFNDTVTINSTSNNALTIAGANGGLNFTGSGNRVYFTSNRALEGATDGSTLTVGEGFTTIRLSNAVVANEAGADADFRVESDGNANMLFVDGTNNRVGVGRVPTVEALEVAGNLKLEADNAEINLRSGVGGTSGAINWTFNTDTTDFASIKLDYDTRATVGLHMDVGYPIRIDSSSSGGITFLASTVNTNIFSSTTNTFNEQGNNVDFRVESDSNANALYVDAAQDSVGILTNATDAALNVNSQSGTKDAIRIVGSGGNNFIAGYGNQGNIAFSITELGADDPGVFTLYRNGIASHILDPDAGSETVFNEQGEDVDFRVETDATSNGFVVNAGSGTVCVGRSNTWSFGTNTTPGFAVNVTSGRLDVAADSVARITQINDATGTYDRFYRGSSIVGSITTDGSNTAYNTSSDQRLKENIADADDAGSKIDAIQVRKYDWKADGSHQDYGMVAQELIEVAPEAVSAPEDPEEMMGVDYSKLVPMLIKEIQSLRARVADLES